MRRIGYHVITVRDVELLLEDGRTCPAVERTETYYPAATEGASTAPEMTIRQYRLPVEQIV